MGLEITEQLGWQMPGVIVYPAGRGVGIIGIHKVLRELPELGWVTGDLPPTGRRPAGGMRADRDGLPGLALPRASRGRTPRGWRSASRFRSPWATSVLRR